MRTTTAAASSAASLPLPLSLSFWSLKCLPYGPRRSHTTLSLHELFFARAFFNSFDLSLHFHLARSLTLSDFACACLVALLSLTTRMHALSRIVVVAALSFDYLEANALRWPEA